ncbi:hypothetical protein T4A_11305 [Trichinella pseudospiralis]|uniref:Uncharacterized protein n=1 Tax=Trichinella pseudospiralis TaxID=6337 RepID=A0A0V1ESB9_TRIPS|nr:hypothetical protein T4A_11305 [Trichinella pseudospiralis]
MSACSLTLRRRKQRMARTGHSAWFRWIRLLHRTLSGTSVRCRIPGRPHDAGDTTSASVDRLPAHPSSKRILRDLLCERPVAAAEPGGGVWPVDNCWEDLAVPVPRGDPLGIFPQQERALLRTSSGLQIRPQWCLRRKVSPNDLISQNFRKVLSSECSPLLKKTPACEGR